MKGIGKRAFIRELKTIGLAEKCFEFAFVERLDSIDFLLENLLTKLNITFFQNEIEDLPPNRPWPILKRLFEEFDKIKDAKIIFYNIEQIYNSKKGRFFYKEIEHFFHYLLQRPSYRGNKVYLVSNENFSFKRIEDRNLTYEIKLNPLNVEHTKFILERSFNEKNKAELGRAIMKYKDETIDNLTGGHPQITKLFAEVCECFGLNEVINDELTRKQFENEKVAYLMEIIQTDAKEKRLLDYLALFKTNAPLEAIKKIDSNPYETIKRLQGKFLLEIIDYSTHSEFYLPSLIKDYSMSKMNESTLTKNHTLIGDYYWSKAEDIQTATPKILEFYRLALHHYWQAKNKEKEQELVWRFKGIFLNKADELYKNGDFEQAFHYYNYLYEHAELNEEELNYFLTCNVKLDKENTRELFEKALSLERYNTPYIKVSYVNYLLNKKDYEKAEIICREAIKDNPNDPVASSLLAKVKNERGETDKAIELLENRISYLKKKSLEEHERKELKSLHMNYYDILDNYKLLKNTVSEVATLLRKDNVYLEDLGNIFVDEIRSNVSEIEEAFEKAMNHKDVQRVLYFNYLNFLKRQRRIEEAKDISRKLPSIKSKHGIKPISQKRFYFIETDIEDALKKAYEFGSKQIHIDKSKGNENYRTLIENKIDNCRKALKRSWELVQEVLNMDTNWYPALYASVNLLINFQDLSNLTRIVEISYDNDLRNNHLKQREAKKTVFISYNHHDSKFVHRLKRAIEKNLIGIKIDIETLKFGDNIQSFIEHSVRETDFTISIISKNSLRSAWVILEALETIMHEKVTHQKKFIPIFIDDVFSQETIHSKIIEDIDQSLDKLNEEISNLSQKHVTTTNLDVRKNRLLELRHNIDKILTRLNESLVGDFSSEEKFNENLPKLIYQIENESDYLS